MATFLSRLRASFAVIGFAVSLLACAQTNPPAATTAQATPAAPTASLASAPPPPPVPNHDAAQIKVTPCPAQRSEICPSVHKPVCAQRDTGVRCVRAPCPSEASVTFSNACSACRDPKVSGYVEGECGKTKANM